MDLWIPLAADAESFVPRAVEVIKMAFDGLVFASGLVPVDCFPGLGSGEGEFVGGDAEDDTCGASVCFGRLSTGE